MSAGSLEALHTGTLADVLDRILDKGIVVNADITVSLVGVELLGLKIRLALASFETAALYGLEFPSGVNLEAPAWRELGRPDADPGNGRISTREARGLVTANARDGASARVVPDIVAGTEIGWPEDSG